MKIGFIGLGRMGIGMTKLLLEKGHDVVGFDVDRGALEELSGAGGIDASSMEDLVSKLEAPRVIWVMVQRAHVEEILTQIFPCLEKGDTVIDGGNTYYLDSMRRAETFTEAGFNYIDVGVSGGVRAARTGACLMVGGSREVFEKLESLFCDLTVPEGYGYMGLSGAGHFVKGIHNGIEYGMMASQAEGFSAIESMRDKLGTDLGEVMNVYQHGSIIESRLIGFLLSVWKGDPQLASLEGIVPKGDTEEEMLELTKTFDLPMLEEAINVRTETRKESSFAGKIMSAQRNEFGGHIVVSTKP